MTIMQQHTTDINENWEINHLHETLPDNNKWEELVT